MLIRSGSSGRIVCPFPGEWKTMKKTILASVCTGLIGLIVSMPAAADSSVLRVLVVQAPDVAAYIKEVQTLSALLKKLGQQVTIRAWRATYAGPDTGAIIVSIELPNLAALGKLNDTVQTNPDAAAEMKKIGGLRHVVSDSLYESLP
jgi:hypothetical protein